ncbi:MAG: hypothetical protein K6F50_06725 [Kiritimatiellae bacterium]|nr:hypothetical protein [Kiritimatiellia bacterium]
MTLPAVLCAAVLTNPAVPGLYGGPWEVSVSAGGKTESRLLDMEGNLVAGPFAAKKFTVPQVETWNAENPVWYVLETVEDGVKEETVFGFSERKLTDHGFFVNGRNVCLKFGPKELNGNAAIEGGPVSPEEAWKNGVYLLPGSVKTPDARCGDGDAMFHAFRDWSVTGTNYNQRFVVRNRNSFIDATGVTCRWHLLLDGEEEDDGVVDLYGLGPGQETVHDMIPEAIEALSGGKSVSVRFTFEDEDGKTLAEDQIDLALARELDSLAGPKGWIPDWLAFGFMKPKVGFSLETAGAANKVRTFKANGLKFKYGDDATEEGALWKTGLIFDTMLVHSVLPCREVPADGGPFVLRKPLFPVVNREGALSFVSVGERNGVGYSAEWTVHPFGVVSVKARLKATAAPFGTRLGFVFQCPTSSFRTWAGEELEWFGLGRRATRPGDAEGAFLGRWETEIQSPPWSFSAEEVRGVRLGGFTVRTLGVPFAISADSGSLSVFVSPGEDGHAEISFTISINDKSLSARTPCDGADLPSL